MSHFAKRLAEITGQQPLVDLFACPRGAARCRCGPPCDLCDQPPHSPMHAGKSGRRGKLFAHRYVAAPAKEAA